MRLLRGLLFSGGKPEEWNTACSLPPWSNRPTLPLQRCGTMRLFIARASELDAHVSMYACMSRSHSAVVLSELRRGARTTQAARTVARLHELASTIWEPTATNWWQAGRIIQTVGDAHDWDRSKRRDVRDDALIALTAASMWSTTRWSCFPQDHPFAPGGRFASLLVRDRDLAEGLAIGFDGL